jgi:hypothetical protein
VRMRKTNDVTFADGSAGSGCARTLSNRSGKSKQRFGS